MGIYAGLPHINSTSVPQFFKVFETMFQPFTITNIERNSR